MSSIRYEVLLPLKYNDGSVIEDEKFEQTWFELVTEFHGLTIQPQTLRGLWMHEGQVYEDSLIRVVLDVPDDEKTERFFRCCKETLKERFHQIDIWMTAYPIRIL